jgi:glycosyltransferase involved in cell wall biosynthesis
MQSPESLRVGYVVKRYPRFSETFIVREILAHERAGLAVDIFCLRASNDTHFQDLIARVRAPVHYLYYATQGLLPEGLSAIVTTSYFWNALREAAAVVPGLWAALEEAQDEEARDVYQAATLAAKVRRLNITHLHAPFAHDVCTVARLAARFAGIPYSFTARAKDIFHDTVRPEDLRRKLRDAAGVVTVSDYHLDYLRKTYGPLAARVQRIYNGLDLDEFPYRPPHDRPPVILAVGRLVEKKGFADLVEACAMLAGRGRPFRCRLVGEGELQANLQAQIERLGLQGRVELLGPLPQCEVIREMQGAALLAMPCVVAPDGDRDGLPNVIQEALALGTPVVTTDVTGIPEVVRHGETGLLVPQHDPPALADAVERLLADPDLRVRLAAGGRRLIEAEFDNRRTSARRRALFGAAQAIGNGDGGMGSADGAAEAPFRTPRAALGEAQEVG